MIWEFIKYTLIILFGYIIWTKIIRETFTWLSLRSQGVKFMPGFPPITDFIKVGIEIEKDRTIIPLTETMQKYLGTPLPNFTGMVLFGTTLIFVNKAELLEDFYVKKNQFYSKSWTEIDLNTPFLKFGPFVQRSEDPQYAPQRKILSAAFYKQKMEGMIQIIKSTTIELVRKIRKENEDGATVDFIQIAIELMSTLIVNVSAGHGKAYDLIKFKEGNETKMIPIYQGMIYIIRDAILRTESLPLLLFPSLTASDNMPWDADFKFNIEQIHNKLQSYVDERLQDPDSNEKYDDILQYLLKDDYYSKNKHEIKDILFSFFFAGA